MSGSSDIDEVAFADNLREYFEVGAGAAAPLLDTWRGVRGDDRAMAALERHLASDEPAVAGLAWWEERPAGRSLTLLDRINGWLSTEPTLTPRPVPRAYRPPWLVGTWRWVGWAVDGSRFEAVAPERRWRLHADGRLDAAGPDPEGVHGGRWRLHRAHPDELWISRPDDVHPRKWMLWPRDGVIELRPPASTRARGRLERMDIEAASR